MRKLITMVSVCALIVFASIIGVNAADSQGFYYSLQKDGTLKGVCPTPELSGKIVVPSEIDGHKVVSIESSAKTWANATEIVFPDGDIQIANPMTNPYYFFPNCTKLERVTIGKGNKGEVCFDRDTEYTNLKEITLNGGALYSLYAPLNGSNIHLNIGEDVDLPLGFLVDYSAYSSISISPNNPKYFSTGNAIYNKDKTELLFYVGADDAYELSLLPTTKKIAEDAIRSCNNLKELYLPDGLEEIDSGNFEDCPNLENVIIPNSVTSLYGGFSYCPNLKTAYISKNIDNIGSWTFVDIGAGGEGWKGALPNMAKFYIYQGSYFEQYMTSRWEDCSGSLDLFEQYNGYRPQFDYEYITEIYNKYTSPVLVTYKNNYLGFDQPPTIIDGRTLVPLRTIFEALGASVEWNGETQTVTAKKDSDTVSLTIGSNILYKNSSSTELDVTAQIINDRTLVPARAVAEAFGCNVGWDGDTRTVTITE